MKISWRVIVAIALIVTISMTIMDFFFSLDPDKDLSQYQVQEISPNIGVEVLDYVAGAVDKVYIPSKDIGEIKEE